MNILGSALCLTTLLSHLLILEARMECEVARAETPFGLHYEPFQGAIYPKVCVKTSPRSFNSHDCCYPITELKHTNTMDLQRVTHLEVKRCAYSADCRRFVTRVVPRQN